MDIEELKKFAESMLSRTRKLVELNHDIVPMSFFLTDGGNLKIVALTGGKEEMTEFINEQAKSEDAYVIVIFDSEITKVPIEDPLLPAEHGEGLKITIFGPGIERIDGMQEYKRADDGIIWEQIVWFPVGSKRSFSKKDGIIIH